MTYKLARERLGEWLQKISDGKRLIAPMRDNQGRLVFDQVTDLAQIVNEPGIVPEGVKRWFYPPSEEMFRYTGAGPKVRVYERPEDGSEQVIFGARPCDAAALDYSARFWDSDQGDPYYARKRAATLVVALNCETAEPECFCESISCALSNPRGMDLLVTRLSDKEYLVESFSEKGETVLNSTKDMMDAAEDDAVEARQALADKVGQQQKRHIPAESITQAIQGVFKDEAFWRKHTAACIGCGVCTFLCPTCTCFDVMDDAVGGTGFRYRCWDTCQFRQFCEEASGHDRRAQQWQRQRQRVAHKLWYSVDRFQELTCVGCGRCVRQCPVNIDICEIASDAAAQGEDK